jgi:hypothetical protein
MSKMKELYTSRSGTMPIESFVCSRAWKDNLGEFLCDQLLKGDAGYVYLGAYWIARVPVYYPKTQTTSTLYFMMIGRDSWMSSDLGDLERKLYQYALGEGACEVSCVPEKFVLGGMLVRQAQLLDNAMVITGVVEIADVNFHVELVQLEDDNDGTQCAVLDPDKIYVNSSDERVQTIILPFIDGDWLLHVFPFGA